MFHFASFPVLPCVSFSLCFIQFVLTVVHGSGRAIIERGRPGRINHVNDIW